MSPIKTYLEIGKKRVFAGVVDWPGWCRSGKDEEAALGTLVDYGLRYARVLHPHELEFHVPSGRSKLLVTERHTGNASTDFGAPAIILDADREPLEQRELERLQLILQACWEAFDDAVERAVGLELRKGPRGGGRDLSKMIEHVLEADLAYLRRLAWKYTQEDGSNPAEELRQTRQAILGALDVAVNQGLPEQGPRGGLFWPPRYFVRRVAWHVLDHAWEIEDRIV